MEAYLRDLNLRLVRSLNGEPKWHGTYVIQMVSGGKGSYFIDSLQNEPGQGNMVPMEQFAH